MTISEACKFEIEDSVDTACDKSGISKTEAFQALEKFYNSIGVKITFSGVKGKYYRAKEKVTDVTLPKPLRKHTKPEVKKQLNDLVSAIDNDEVSDDDVKKIVDKVADKVENGSYSKRVCTKAHTAVRKVNKNRKEVTVKDINNYQRLWKHVLSTSEGLQILADGSMPSPETEEEAEALKGIIMALPHLCLQTARMGVDLMEIHESLQKGETKNEKKYIDI